MNILIDILDALNKRLQHTCGRLRDGLEFILDCQVLQGVYQIKADFTSPYITLPTPDRHPSHIHYQITVKTAQTVPIQNVLVTTNSQSMIPRKCNKYTRSVIEHIPYIDPKAPTKQQTNARRRETRPK